MNTTDEQEGIGEGCHLSSLILYVDAMPIAFLTSVTTSSSMAEIDCASAFAGSGAWRVKARLMMSREMGTLFFVLCGVRGGKQPENRQA